MFVDEHPDSINDSIFHFKPGFMPSDYAWRDLPASYHNNACDFSFADGHSEIKKWKHPETLKAVRMVSKWWTPPADLGARASVDYEWLNQKMPFTE